MRKKHNLRGSARENVEILNKEPKLFVYIKKGMVFFTKNGLFWLFLGVKTGKCPLSIETGPFIRNRSLRSIPDTSARIHLKSSQPPNEPSGDPTSSLIMRKSRAGTVVLASVDTAVIPGYNLKLHDLSSCSESLLREFSFFFMCVLGRAQKTHVRSEWRFEQNSPTLKI